jgi:hypothetical protein
MKAWLSDWWAQFRCERLGWHHPGINPIGFDGASLTRIGFDGASLTGNCGRCGRRILQDSQGNWFSV